MKVDIKEYIKNLETLKTMVNNLHDITIHTEECIDEATSFMDYLSYSADKGNAILEAKVKSDKTLIDFTTKTIDDGKSFITIVIDHTADSGDTFKYTLTSSPDED